MRRSSASRSASTRTSEPIRPGLIALFVGFTIAVIVTFLFSVIVRAFGWETELFSLGIRPVSNLINSPNVFSVVVATLAGIVGVVSLVEARTGALIGVFISVTTIPAAADIGVSAAFDNWERGTRLAHPAAVERRDPDRRRRGRAHGATTNVGTHRETDDRAEPEGLTR